MIDRRGLMAGAGAAALGVSPAFAQMAGGPVSWTPAPYRPPGKLLTHIGRKLCVVGDSYAGQNGNFVSGTNLNNLGAVTLLNMFAGWPFVFTPYDVFATNGGQLTQIISYLPAIVAGGYDFCVVQGCHNDCFNGRSLSAIQADYKTIASTLLAANIIPIIGATSPMSSILGGPGSPPGPTLAQCVLLAQSTNSWKRSWCEANHLPFWDWYTPAVDLSPGSAGAYPVGYSGDLVHPGKRSNMAVAKQGLVDLAAIIPPPLSRTEAVALDMIDTTYNPYGNFMPGSGLNWSGGGTIQTGSFGSGSVAAGMTFAKTYGTATAGNVTCSLVPASDGLGDWQQFSFSGPWTAGSNQEKWLFFCFINQANYAPGDVFESDIEVSVDANSPFSEVGLFCAEQNKDNSQVKCNLIGPDSEPGVTYAWSGVMRTSPLTVPANSATGSAARILFPQCEMIFDASAATGNPNFSGTVSFRRWRVSKVPPS
jgi:hypothetical protein